jgi:sucrose phosphorylase
LPSRQTAFFNFTASHDGVGVRPLEGILTDLEIDRLCRLGLEKGGQVSKKKNSDGSLSPYELNVTYVDAVGANDSLGTHKHAQRFLTTQAIALSLPGVPGIYIHSLLGSHNWHEGVRKTGRARSINREQLDRTTLLNELNQPASFRAQVFYPYCHMLEIRRRQPAFDPRAAAIVLEMDDRQRVFALKRESEQQTLYVLSNITDQPISVSLDAHGLKPKVKELLTNRYVSTAPLKLAPLQTVWLDGGKQAF